MSFLSLTFRDLQYLVALADNKHFGKAAKSCFVSQPALSSQIKKIEGYFDKQFFERKNKEVFLTHEGAFIVEKARAILENARLIDRTMQAHSSVFSFPLSIGIIYTLSPYYPAIVIPQFLKKYPNHSMLLREGYTQELIPDLKSGKIDGLIASEVLQDEQLMTFPIFKEKLYLLINKNHPYAAKNNLKLTDLNTEDMIFLKEGNCLRSEAIDLCPKNKRGNINEFHLNSLETLKYTVAMHSVYAIIPEMAIKLNHDLKSFVVIKEIQSASAYRQISLFVRKNTYRMEDLQILLDILRISGAQKYLSNYSAPT